MVGVAVGVAAGGLVEGVAGEPVVAASIEPHGRRGLREGERGEHAHRDAGDADPGQLLGQLLAVPHDVVILR